MTNHILKLTNVYYKKKYFLITNYKKKNLSKYLDNYKFLDSNINPTKIIDKPVFVINGLFNCFTHAIFDNIFSYFWAMNDIRNDEKKEMDFICFVKKLGRGTKSIRDYDKNIYVPILDKNTQKYNSVWDDLKNIITKNDLIFEDFILDNEILFIKECYLYIKNDNNQRSPWNCAENYSKGRKIKKKDVLYKDHIVKENLLKFINHTKNLYNIPNSLVNKKKKIIIINRKTTYRNLNKFLKEINKIIKMQNKYIYQGTYFLEDLSFREQILLFRDIDLIITPHGANLTHIIWFQNKEYITYYDKDGQQIMFKHIANLTNNKFTTVTEDKFINLIKKKLL